VLINWFTMGAQLINFLVLMVLLKKFLYDRIIRAMDEREKKIASQLEEADRKRQSADARQEEIAAEKKELDKTRETLLAEAREAARKEKEALQEEARQAVDALRQRWVDALEQEKEAFGKRIRESAARQVFAVAQKALEEMAGETLQDRVVERFIRRIQAMDETEKQALSQAPAAEPAAVAVVRSARAVPAEKQREITQWLTREIHPDLDVEYQPEEALGVGIELRISGKKVSWTLHQYLEELEERVLEALDEEGPGRAAPETGRDHRDNFEAEEDS
jgi:F-type H+-transporting ATPase subunit b